MTDNTSVYSFINEHTIPIDGMLVYHDQTCIVASYHDTFSMHEPRRMYSLTKTITALCIGICLDKGVLSLSMTLGDLFPEYPEIHPWVSMTTVENLLMMRTPFKKTTYKNSPKGSWLDSYFSQKPDKKPGTTFAYDTSGTYVLGCIIRRVTQCDVYDFMCMNLFEPLGFKDRTVLLKSPEGFDHTGSGLIASPRDMLKILNLINDGGIHEGKQLVSPQFIKNMCTPLTPVVDPLSPLHSHYGYQLWVFDRGWMMWGMGGQYLISIPSQTVKCLVMSNMMAIRTCESEFATHLKQSLLDTTLQVSTITRGEQTVRETSTVSRFQGHGFIVEIRPGSCTIQTPSWRETIFTAHQGCSTHFMGMKSWCFGGWLSSTCFKLEINIRDVEIGWSQLILEEQGDRWILKNSVWMEQYNEDYSIQSVALKKDTP